MLTVEGVRKRFGAHPVLAGVDLQAARGETVALLGPSGCGKTTLLRLLAGFGTPDAGRIVLDGRDLGGLSPAARGIGLVFQDYALFPHMTVAANVEYGLRRRGQPRAEREARRDAVLGLVRLRGLEARRPAQLSGGQQQRVALARALAIRPPLLLLDEPLSNLDAKLRTALAAELREVLAEAGTTTLVVTHDQAEAMSLGDRIAVMAAGRIVQAGAATELYGRPACRFVAEFLGRCNWLTGDVVRDGEQLRLLLPDGPLLVSGSAAGAVGCCIRPEAVRVLAPGEAAGPNARTAEVAQATFLGQEVLLRATLRGGPALLISTAPRLAAHCQPGAAITIDIAPDDCRLLPEDAIP